jgi:hypothetical protein
LTSVSSLLSVWALWAFYDPAASSEGQLVTPICDRMVRAAYLVHFCGLLLRQHLLFHQCDRSSELGRLGQVQIDELRPRVHAVSRLLDGDRVDPGLRRARPKVADLARLVIG